LYGSSENFIFLRETFNTQIDLSHREAELSPTHLLEPDDPVYLWRERMPDLHSGIARRAPGFPIQV
jgi:hypothetical protein